MAESLLLPDSESTIKIAERILSALPRPAIEAIIQAGIQILDSLDMDSDFEPEEDACQGNDDGGYTIPYGHGTPGWNGGTRWFGI